VADHLAYAHPPMVSLVQPPIGFAHRGAKKHAPENTLEAFLLAKRLGASGFESDVWVTADGHPVLDHDGVVKTGVRRRMIRDVNRSELPSHVPGLDDLYASVGTALPLSLDLKDADAIGPTVAIARAAGSEATQNLWLCDWDWERLAADRSRYPDVRMVDSTRLKRLKVGPERHAAKLSSAGIDAINMHYTDWNLGLTTLFHRFDLITFGWDAQFERVIRDLIAMEIDGLYCDDTELMMSVVNGFVPPVH
jgi:glycerophosphoryl diester phosphodiesterase